MLLPARLMRLDRLLSYWLQETQLCPLYMWWTRYQTWLSNTHTHTLSCWSDCNLLSEAWRMHQWSVICCSVMSIQPEHVPPSHTGQLSSIHQLVLYEVVHCRSSVWQQFYSWQYPNTEVHTSSEPAFLLLVNKAFNLKKLEAFLTRESDVYNTTLMLHWRVRAAGWIYQGSF